jgi:hypothetical protein
LPKKLSWSGKLIVEDPIVSHFPEVEEPAATKQIGQVSAAVPSCFCSLNNLVAICKSYQSKDMLCPCFTSFGVARQLLSFVFLSLLLALCYGFGFFLCSSVFQFSFPALQHSLF